MKKSTMSLLLSAMMAVSGLAAAQPAAPANDVKSGTQGGSGPSANEKAAPGNMPNSRADVKAQATPEKSGSQGGEGATKAENPNTAKGTKMTAAERRAAKASKGKRTPASKADVQKDGKAGS